MDDHNISVGVHNRNPQPEFITRSEAAEYLQNKGIYATESWLTRNAGSVIPTHKFGIRVRYTISDLEDYINSTVGRTNA